MGSAPIRTVAAAGRYAGRDVWVFPNSGRIVPVVAGGDGPTPPAPPAPTPPAPPAPVLPTPPAPAPRTFEQAEVDRIAAREKDEGRKAAEAAIAEQLGCTPAEAKAMLDKSREAEKAAMTEAERAKTEAAEAKAAAERDRAATAAELLQQRKITALATEGITDAKKAERIADLVKCDVGADRDAVAKAVGDLKAEMPELFAAAPAPGGGPLPSGAPGGKPPAGGPPAGDRGALGKAAAEKYNRDRPLQPVRGITSLKDLAGSQQTQAS